MFLSVLFLALDPRIVLSLISSLRCQLGPTPAFTPSSYLVLMCTNPRLKLIYNLSSLQSHLVKYIGQKGK